MTIMCEECGVRKAEKIVRQDGYTLRVCCECAEQAAIDAHLFNDGMDDGSQK